MAAPIDRTGYWTIRGREVAVFSVDEVPSTNALARELAESGGLRRPTVVRAARQTGGYGRFGRAWHSPQGGLWMTLAWPVEGDSGRLIQGLGLRVGAACFDVVRSLLAGDGIAALVQLKWPNDVLIDGGKVCGCLCERVGGGEGRTSLIVGVGINVNNDPPGFPADLRRPAASLRVVLGRSVDLHALLHDLCERLITAIDPGAPGSHDAAECGQMVARAAASLWGLGERVSARLPDGTIAMGTLRGLSEDGRLVLDAAGARGPLPHGAELA